MIHTYEYHLTHPYGQDFPAWEGIMRLPARRSSLQAAEIEVRDGKLIVDRDKPFRMQLTPPPSAGKIQ
jgi:hypothetical protein